MEMEKGKRPGKTPLSNKRKIEAVLVAVLILSISILSTWFIFLRPLSVDDIAYHFFDPGDTVVVEGTISEVEHFNTSYGNITMVSLEGKTIAADAYKFIGEPGRTYHPGDRFRITLHFQRFQFNNRTLITAPEIFSSLFLLPMSLEEVEDASSFLEGILLVPETYERPTKEYVVFTPSNDSYPLEMFNASLLKMEINERLDKPPIVKNGVYNHLTYPALFAEEYLNVGNTSSMKRLDFIRNLKDGASENGTLVFRDSNSNGMLDDGDRFIVNIPNTRDRNDIQTYLLTVSGPKGRFSSYAEGMKYIINWYDGPYTHKDKPFLEMTIKHATEKRLVLECKNTSYPAKIPLKSMRLRMVFKYEYAEFNLSSGHDFNEEYGIAARAEDLNGNSLFDKGDTLVLTGNLSRKCTIDVWTENMSQLTYVSWCPKYGHISGNLPDITHTDETIDGEKKIGIHMSYTHPIMSLSNTTVSFTHSSETLIDSAPLRNGMLFEGSSGNISFVDADMNGMLSNGDYFLFSGRLQSGTLSIMLPCDEEKIIEF